MACGRLQPGDRVRMTEAYKARMREPCTTHVPGTEATDGCWRCHPPTHLDELGDCVGIVLGPVDHDNVPSTDPTWNPRAVGPEVDVRWQPSNLRYAYDPTELEPA